MSKSIYEEATDKNIITKQVVINTPTSARLLPITADEKVIDEIQQALTKLEQAQKQEKLLNKIKEIIDIQEDSYILSMLEESKRYYEIKKLMIKELENE